MRGDGHHRPGQRLAGRRPAGATPPPRRRRRRRPDHRTVHLLRPGHGGVPGVGRRGRQRRQIERRGRRRQLPLGELRRHEVGRGPERRSEGRPLEPDFRVRGRDRRRASRDRRRRGDAGDRDGDARGTDGDGRRPGTGRQGRGVPAGRPRAARGDAGGVRDDRFPPHVPERQRRSAGPDPARRDRPPRAGGARKHQRPAERPRRADGDRDAVRDGPRRRPDRERPARRGGSGLEADGPAPAGRGERPDRAGRPADPAARRPLRRRPGRGASRRRWPS